MRAHNFKKIQTLLVMKILSRFVLRSDGFQPRFKHFTHKCIFFATHQLEKHLSSGRDK